jgi:signal transduction histidine kinase
VTTTSLQEHGSSPSLQVLAQLQRERDLYAAGLSDLGLRYEQKVQELSVLRRMSDVLRDCTELEELFRRLLAIVQEELATAACSIYLADETGELVLRARCSGEGAVEVLPPGHVDACRIPAGSGPLGETFATGQVLATSPLPAGAPGWTPPDASTLLTAPLGPEGGCMGVLALHGRDGGHVWDDATRLLPILATHATIAIENAALYRRLKRHSDTLEARVRERTAALEHLNAELQAGARQKSQFFAHFSHELRTPLNSILGFAEMLRSEMCGSLNERQHRYIRHVHESGNRLLRLITDILDLAKVEAGKLSLQTRAIAVPPTIEQALAVMQPQASEKHLRMTQTAPDDLPEVEADPARVHQILLNLLSNAIKFTSDGGLVTVSARPLAPNREPGSMAEGEEGMADGRVVEPIAALRTEPAFLEIAVQDTGVGIAPEDQQRLFQAFEQVAAGRQQGTGLGLSLTRRLVELHGGQVGMASAPGMGSRFWFTLPVARPTPDGERSNQREAGRS